MTGVTFQDFPLGREIVTQRVTVTETHIVQWAGLTGDWYPIHMDEAFARDSPFGERIAHGPLTFALAVGLVAQTGALGDSVIAWLGATDMRAKAPVRIGDTIGVRATVMAARLTRDPGRGVVTLRYVVSTSEDVDVLQFDFTLMMRVGADDDRA